MQLKKKAMTGAMYTVLGLLVLVVVITALYPTFIQQTNNATAEANGATSNSGIWKAVLVFIPIGLLVAVAVYMFGHKRKM